ncbi:hypothetical protein DCS_03359 [Drechmeria coniospora]|uniref:Uncharacterized protein n=1 Tax=Drechmeria coniospora TaxID=98403 RepID=A0A151GGY8_DRECN|nr:hypothetical protein DCS_03359 [Drechmeria coniospora]KYK56359.1 hypothetical protein DCS_03359 [Drechmeria coniospora]
MRPFSSLLVSALLLFQQTSFVFAVPPPASSSGGLKPRAGPAAGPKLVWVVTTLSVGDIKGAGGVLPRGNTGWSLWAHYHGAEDSVWVSATASEEASRMILSGKARTVMLVHAGPNCISDLETLGRHVPVDADAYSFLGGVRSGQIIRYMTMSKNNEVIRTVENEFYTPGFYEPLRASGGQYGLAGFPIDHVALTELPWSAAILQTGPAALKLFMDSIAESVGWHGAMPLIDKPGLVFTAGVNIFKDLEVIEKAENVALRASKSAKAFDQFVTAQDAYKSAESNLWRVARLVSDTTFLSREYYDRAWQMMLTAAKAMTNIQWGANTQQAAELLEKIHSDSKELQKLAEEHGMGEKATGERATSLTSSVMTNVQSLEELLDRLTDENEKNTMQVEELQKTLRFGKDSPQVRRLNEGIQWLGKYREGKEKAIERAVAKHDAIIQVQNPYLEKLKPMVHEAREVVKAIDAEVQSRETFARNMETLKHLAPEGSYVQTGALVALSLLSSIAVGGALTLASLKQAGVTMLGSGTMAQRIVLLAHRTLTSSADEFQRLVLNEMGVAVEDVAPDVPQVRGNTRLNLAVGQVELGAASQQLSPESPQAELAKRTKIYRWQDDDEDGKIVSRAVSLVMEQILAEAGRHGFELARRGMELAQAKKGHTSG